MSGACENIHNPSKRLYGSGNLTQPKRVETNKNEIIHYFFRRLIYSFFNGFTQLGHFIFNISQPNWFSSFSLATLPLCQPFFIYLSPNWIASFFKRVIPPLWVTPRVTLISIKTAYVFTGFTYLSYMSFHKQLSPFRRRMVNRSSFFTFTTSKTIWGNTIRSHSLSYI